VLEAASGHTFINSLHAAYQTREHVYFVLDFCTGGDLFNKLKSSPFERLAEKEAAFYCAEIILALEYLHSKGVLFRDIKLENVMLDSRGHVQLVDFGLAKFLGTGDAAYQSSLPVSPCGSVVYMPPELILSASGGGFAVDWWGLGVLMHEMLTGKAPWKSLDPTDILDELRVHRPVQLSSPVLSTKAKAILGGLLTRDPKKRYGNPGKRQNGWELKTHPFWWPELQRPDQWEALGRREIAPPPQNAGGADNADGLDSPPPPPPAIGVLSPGGKSWVGSFSTPPAEVPTPGAGQGAADDTLSMAEAAPLARTNFTSPQRRLALSKVAEEVPGAEGQRAAGSVGVVFKGFVECLGGLRLGEAALAELSEHVEEDLSVGFLSDEETVAETVAEAAAGAEGEVGGEVEAEAERGERQGLEAEDQSRSSSTSTTIVEEEGKPSPQRDSPKEGNVSL